MAHNATAPVRSSRSDGPCAWPEVAVLARALKPRRGRLHERRMKDPLRTRSAAWAQGVDQVGDGADQCRREMVVQQRAQQWVSVRPDAIRSGDLVSADAGGLPIYRVLAVQDRRTWLREERTGRDHVAPLGGLLWKLAPEAETGTAPERAH